MSTVSVVVPSYNHGRYVEQAIRSVLDQTFGDIDVIVVDDRSTDDSVANILRIEDTRLNLIPLGANIGGAGALNYGIKNARSEFIAICNSDDAWVPDKLAKQLAYLRSHPEVAAVFSDVEWMGQDGNALSHSPYLNLFSQRNRSRFRWILDLMEGGNVLCHPSILVRRTIYDDIGVYNPWLRQVPDLDMWFRLLSQHEIYVTSERLVRFRWHGGNTSEPSAETSRRSANEHLAVLSSFFDAASNELLGEVFGFLPHPFAPEGVNNRVAAIKFLLTSNSPAAGMLRQVGAQLLVEMVREGAPPSLQETIKPSEFWASLGGVWMTELASPSFPADASRLSTRALARTLARRVLYKLGFRL